MIIPVFIKAENDHSLPIRDGWPHQLSREERPLGLLSHTTGEKNGL